MIKQFRDPQLDTSGDVVGFYEREFYVFSNFSSFQVRIGDHLFPTTEHAYHCAKFDLESVEWYAVKESLSAHDSFVTAHKLAHLQRDDWDDVKVSVMTDICRAKLQQHEYVQRKLDQTEDYLLVEDSPKDSFWGWGPDHKGRNELGWIWMLLRDEMRNND